MESYRITTLVDITRSRPTRSDTDHVRQSQQANFNSLIQAIGLRAIIFSDRDPQLNEGRLPEPFEGKARYWVYEFIVDRDEIFLSNKDPVGLLKQDLDGVPIIDQLNNDVGFKIPAFRTLGSEINTKIEILSNPNK